MPVIEFCGVSFSYGDTEVLREVSFKIEKGEFVAVMGKNGSGKSTLARLINGLLLPASGRVLTCGADTADADGIYGIRRRAAFVFQNPDDGIVSAVVEDEAAFTAENLGIEPGEIRRRVDAALKRTGLYEKRFELTAELSGGEKQRLAVASALTAGPEILILDEPTSMLDPEGRRSVISLVKELAAEGMTAVIVTHDPEEAALAGRCIVTGGGGIAFDGTPEELFSDAELLKKHSLAAPDMRRFADALRAYGIDVPDGIYEPGAMAEAIAAALGAKSKTFAPRLEKTKEILYNSIK